MLPAALFSVCWPRRLDAPVVLRLFPGPHIPFNACHVRRIFKAAGWLVLATVGTAAPPAVLHVFFFLCEGYLAPTRCAGARRAREQHADSAVSAV